MGNHVPGGIAMELSYVRENAERVMEELERACRAAGRTPPTLVAVTKGGTDEEVLALVHTGLISHIAENRVDKFLARRNLLTADGYRGGFHMIGSLQTNKVKHLIGKTTLIQSLDSLALARELEKRAEAAEVGEVVATMCENDPDIDSDRIVKQSFIHLLLPFIPNVEKGKGIDNLRIQIDKAWKARKKALRNQK